MEYEKLVAEIEQLRKEIWYLKNNSSGGTGGEDEDVSEEISAIENRLDSIETDIETNMNVGEEIDVIYDMRSENEDINRTWTSGATYGKMIRVDFTAYTAIRVFASINGCEVQKVIKVAERKKSDFSVNAINSNFNQVSYLRFSLALNGQAFQVGQYAIYSFDLNNNTFSVEKGSSKDTFFMYRLEGIK